MDKDVFPLLDLQELVVCLQSCDFALANEENISRPSSKYVVTLYKQIIDSFSGISPDALIQSGDRLLGPDKDQADEDSVYKDTLQMLTLNKICFKFFQDIGVPDFNMMDLYKPDSLRTQRFLSAVVNYARFREERMLDCDQFMSQTESLLGQLRQKFDDYNFLQQQVEKYRETSNLAVGETISSLEANNRNLENQLKKLTQVQETFTIDYNNYKSNKRKLMAQLESLGFELIELELQRDKLQRYSEADIPNLQAGIQEFSQMLDDQQDSLSKLQARHRDFSKSMEVFQSITADLYELLGIISTDLQQSHIREVGLLDMRDQLIKSEAKLENLLTSGVVVKLTNLQSQLESRKESIKELENTTRTKQHENTAALQNLQKQFSEEVMPEIQKIDEHVEKELYGNVIKNLERDMQELKDDFKKESDAIELEYSVLAAHINNYMKSMLERIS
ncbi:LANO_0A04302g1_1 [Lachancea nothofagi CBS 11611]|uniref:LANO_0A04302g1_1 n=1 Tax=Lachancea nothofagi CBS 11611 TaxID=1266666 RepID=A0A1G4IQ30_9SACH|nr:LANO_0A04302g1_1 [Lachancea nothofagi CBS 11611]